MKKTVTITLLALAISLTNAQVTFAQSPDQSPVLSASPTTAVENVQTMQIQGNVLVRNNNVITVKTNDETKQITIPSDIKVIRNTMGSKVEDIQPNDRVTVTQTSDGKVLSVDSTAGNVSDFGKWAVPVLIIALVGVMGVLTLIKKGHKSHIKTTIG